MMLEAKLSPAVRSVFNTLGFDATLQTAMQLLLEAENAGHSFLDLTEQANESTEVTEQKQQLWRQLASYADDKHRNVSWTQEAQPESNNPDAVLQLAPPKRVFLRRHWRDETAIAELLRERISVLAVQNQIEHSQAGAKQAKTNPHLDNTLQPVAMALIQHRFAVVSGGPGTGKTTSAASLAWQYAKDLRAQQLRSMVTDSDSTNSDLIGPIQIVLTAPTGKAVARLSSSFQSMLDALQQAEEPKLGRLLAPTQASTVHRLLGYQPQRAQQPLFASSARNPINADLIVLDEASMLSLDLMRRLLQATLPDCALLLLGDAAQLPAIQCGKPFADISKTLATHPSGCAQTLQRQWRATLELSRLTNNLRELAVSSSAAVDTGFADLSKLFQHQDVPLPHAAHMLVQQGYFDPMLAATHAQDAWRLSQQRRMLTALRVGPQGQIALNRDIEAALRQRVRQSHSVGRSSDLRHPELFRGKLLQATVNQPEISLYNGDMLLAWTDAQGDMRLFADADGSLRALDPAVVRAAESAFVITIHKAQGSEFDAVDVLLPTLEDLQPQDFLDRTLLYTALTRARTQATLHGSTSTLRHMLQTDRSRHSGLQDKLKALL